MHYISTRGKAGDTGKSFIDVLLAGLADDGGLYVPKQWPAPFTSEQLNAMKHMTYNEIAVRVISLFTGDEIPHDDLSGMVERAYASFPDGDKIIPLVELNETETIAQLYHTPTYAFKDFAISLLAQMMDYALEKRNETRTIVNATSGDTGGAALHAFKDSKHVKLFVLFPGPDERGIERISDIQRAQMTKEIGENCHPIQINGTFDDCQALVKGMFGNKRFKKKVNLAGVNSINWARIVAQSVYYFFIMSRMDFRETSFVVPCGNFGNIYAGYVAKKLGLPINNLVIAVNENDVLHRFMQSGKLEPENVMITNAPSMDIQNPSNLERIICESDWKENFLSASSTNEIRNEIMKEILQNEKMKGNGCDPHTACAIHASREHPSESNVIISTADPVKFNSTLEKPDDIKKLIESNNKKLELLSNNSSFVMNYIKDNILSLSKSIDNFNYELKLAA